MVFGAPKIQQTSFTPDLLTPFSARKLSELDIPSAKDGYSKDFVDDLLDYLNTIIAKKDEELSEFKVQENLDQGLNLVEQQIGLKSPTFEATGASDELPMVGHESVEDKAEEFSKKEEEYRSVIAKMEEQQRELENEIESLRSQLEQSKDIDTNGSKQAVEVLNLAQQVAEEYKQKAQEEAANLLKLTRQECDDLRNHNKEAILKAKQELSVIADARKAWLNALRSEANDVLSNAESLLAREMPSVSQYTSYAYTQDQPSEDGAVDEGDTENQNEA